MPTIAADQIISSVADVFQDLITAVVDRLPLFLPMDPPVRIN